MRAMVFSACSPPAQGYLISQRRWRATESSARIYSGRYTHAFSRYSTAHKSLFSSMKASVEATVSGSTPKKPEAAPHSLSCGGRRGRSAIVAQHEQKPCAHALPRVILKAHALGNGVRHAEILISGITAQHVRIVGDDLDRIRPVLAEQRDSGGGRQVISRQISDGLPHAEDTLEFVGSRPEPFPA